MSQTVLLMVANNVGFGMPEGTSCLSVSGRTTAAYSCPSLGHPRVHSRVKIGGYKCANVASSLVCKARRNPDFSRQNRHGPSRGRNRNNDGRDIFENFEEDMLSSKNGPLVSLSNSEKSQATSTPGPREKEIVELFRKVQARLRERAAVKEDKKVEAPQGHAKEKSAVVSLLNLLKKHSAEQVKRTGGGDREKGTNSDQLQESSNQESNQYDGGQINNFFNSNSTPKDESREANTSMARPRSSFQRRSPVPRKKYEPIYNTEDDANVVSIGIGSGGNESNQNQIDLKLDDEPELESEPDLETKDELFFPELSEEDSHDSEQTYNDESVEEQLVVQNEVGDLSALKLSELRTLAKSRGLKGFSKMKKSDLVELLTEG